VIADIQIINKAAAAVVPLESGKSVNIMFRVPVTMLYEKTALRINFRSL
jgi:hypothetical protein